MIDPNAISRITIAAMIPMSSPVPAAVSSNVKKRSPPISICSGEPARASATAALRLSRSAVVERRRRSGTARGTMATHRRRGRPPSLVPSTFGRLGDGGLDRVELGLRRRRRGERRGVVDRRHDHLRRDAPPVGAGGAGGGRPRPASRDRARRTSPPSPRRGPLTRRPRGWPRPPRRRRRPTRAWRRICPSGTGNST